MLKKLLLFVFAIVLTANLNKAHASHIPGANITYECDPLNPLTYTFTLTLFRICPGTHPATMSAGYFSITNTCGLANPIVPIFNQTGVAEDVNQLCATATSDCSGGTSPGLWKYTYEATITLPADCDSWNIAFDLCCRDQSSNLTNTINNNMATSTTMNTVTAPCDNSPVVSSVPMPYACANTPFNYCLSISDPEGDSTTYAMVAPAGAGQAPCGFLAGYSAAAPLTGFVLDPLTGCFSFTEPNIGNYVVAIAINSWDSNGNLICTVIHDFQVIVMSCTNTPPTNPAGGLVNFQGNGALLGPNTVGACFGDNVCFDVVFADPVDPTDNITIQQDGTTLLPGATFVQTGTNPATGTFCWLAQPGFTGTVVTFVAQDDGCPVMGTSGFGVNFNIATGVFAGPDPTICGAQNTPLSANGANNYVWSPAAGLSCTTCTNPIATPGTTTTYTLTGDLVGSCPNVDQVTVNVVPDFTPVMNPASVTICANEIVQLDASGPAANGPYSYEWTPISTLNDPLIGNPLAQPSVSTTYTCDMTSAEGCVKSATMDVIVSGIGPTVVISPSDTLICPGSPVPFTTSAFIYPVACGVSAGCSGTNSNFVVGTNSGSTTSYTPFYGSTATATNYTNKSQYIFTAAELNALGYYGGTIRNLGLFFTTSYTYVFDNVEIWIACTSQEEFLTTSFTPVAGMTQVFSGNNINPTNGAWHNFNITDYDWDGTSNLIIQMCAEEGSPTLIDGSESVRYTSTTPAYRCLYDHSSIVGSPSCMEVLGSRVTNRPQMRFGMCVQDAAAPTYSWSPAGTLNDPNIADPIATPGGATSYVLNVTSAGCTGSGLAQVNIDNSNSVLASADTMYCAGDPAFNLGAQFLINGVPAAAGQGSGCYDQTITYANPALLNGTNNFNFAGTPPVSTGGTLTINAYGDLDGTAGNEEMWTIQDENSNTIGSAGAGNTQCGFLHTVVIPLTAVQLNAWSANGSIDFAGIDVAGNVNATLCGAGDDLLELRLQMDCPNGSGYAWSPGTEVSDSTTQYPTVSPGATTTYIVTTTGGTCPATDTVIVTNCLALPVELTSFAGQNLGEINELIWTTAFETNCDYYTVQRSSDGIDFITIAVVDGAGTSTTVLNYRAFDNHPINGVNYYRLIQTDFEGTTSLSDVIAINTTTTSGIQIYPNPSSHDLFIDINESVNEGMHTIMITDVVGKVMLEQIDFSKNQTTYKISNFNALVTGVYLIQVLTDDGEVVKIQKIIKQ
ncbi:MAG: T9SS type A sorting domain-containing protein [Crocinitomicaceae bacterium]|nr:T9SS type A sorting domain-containing protein [Crocinitomicaceae bacterium]